MAIPLRALAVLPLLAVFGASAPAAAVLSDGDLNGDGKIDAADVLMLTRILGNELTVSDDVKTRADVAPINKPRSMPRALNAADLLVLTNALTQPDPDGDGIPTPVELLNHTNPFSRDSDDDGTDDFAELSGHGNPLLADDDGDAWDDGNGDGLFDDPCTGPGPYAANARCDDNCRSTPNPSQADRNNDGVGDACQCGDVSGDGVVDATDRTQMLSWLQAHPGGGSVGAPARCDITGDDLCTLADYVKLNAAVNNGTVANLTSVRSCADPAHVPLARNDTPYPDQTPNYLSELAAFQAQPSQLTNWGDSVVNTVTYESYPYPNVIELRRTGGPGWMRTQASAPGLEAGTPVWALIDSIDRGWPMSTHEWMEKWGIFADAPGWQEFQETIWMTSQGARDLLREHGVLHDPSGLCVQDQAYAQVPLGADCLPTNGSDPNAVFYAVSQNAPRWSTITDWGWQLSPLIANSMSQDNIGGPVSRIGEHFQGRYDGFEIQKFVKYLTQTGRQPTFLAGYGTQPGNLPLLNYLANAPSQDEPANANLRADVDKFHSPSTDFGTALGLGEKLMRDPVLREYELFRHISEIHNLTRYYQHAKQLQAANGRSKLFGYDVQGNQGGSPYGLAIGRYLDTMWWEAGNIAVSAVVDRTRSTDSALRFADALASGRGRRRVVMLNQAAPLDDPASDLQYIEFEWAEASANGGVMQADAGRFEALQRPEVLNRIASYFALRDENRAIYELRGRASYAEVALLRSIPTLVNSSYFDSGADVTEDDHEGAARALAEAHIPFEVVLLDHPDLARDEMTLAELRKRKVIVTEDIRDISKKHACLLYDYVAGRDYVPGSENTNCLTQGAGAPELQGTLMVLGELGKYDENHGVRSGTAGSPGAAGPPLWSALSAAFPARVTRPLSAPGNEIGHFSSRFDLDNSFFPDRRPQLRRLSDPVAALFPTPVVKIQTAPGGSPGDGDLYEMLWARTWTHALDPTLNPDGKDLLSVHFLRYDLIPERGPADPQYPWVPGPLLPTLAPHYPPNTFGPTKVTIRLPAEMTTGSGGTLEGWWLAPGAAAQPLMDPGVFSCTPLGAPTECAVTVPTVGGLADLNGYRVLVIGASGALARSNGLRRGDRYLLRAQFAGEHLNQPLTGPTLAQVAAQRSSANPATYLSQARQVLLTTGDAREAEFDARQSNYLDTTGLTKKFSFTDGSGHPGWNEISTTTIYPGTQNAGWLSTVDLTAPVLDPSTETPEDRDVGDQGIRDRSFDSIQAYAQAWPAEPFESLPVNTSQLSGKARTFRVALSPGTYTFEVTLTSQYPNDAVSGMIRLDGKPVVLDTPRHAGSISRVSFVGTVSGSYADLTFGGPTGFGVALLGIRQGGTPVVDDLDRYGQRGWRVSPRRPNPEWQAMTQHPCSDDVYDLADPDRTGWIRPSVAAAGIPLVDLGPPQHTEIGDVAYAVTDIYRDWPSNELLSLGASSGMIACLNGVEVAEVPNSRGVMRDEQKVPIALHAGRNVLVLKLERFWERRWMFYASVLPPAP